jgi:hypothetical protein
VDRLADAVSDGGTIDWTEATRRTARSEERRVVEGLRLIAELSASTSGTRATDVTSSGTGVDKLETLAVRLILLLAAARLALALGGSFMDAVTQSEYRGGSLGAVAVSFAITGVWLIAGSQRDRRAAALGGFFLTVSSAFAHRFVLRLDGFVHGEVFAVLLRGPLPEAYFPVFLWRFAREFPRVVHLTRLDSLLHWGRRSAWLLCTGAFLGNLAATVLSPGSPEAGPLLGWAARRSGTGMYWIFLFLTATAALTVVWARRQVALPDERSRVTRFLIALLLGFAPTILYVLAAVVAPPLWRWLNEPPALPVVGWITHAALLTMPLAAAAAVFGQGVLSVRLVTGRAIRAVLVRSVVAAGIAVPAIALLAILFVHREDSLGRLLARGQVRLLLTICAAATATAFARRRLLGLVDSQLLRSGHLEDGLRVALRAMQEAPSHTGALQAGAVNARNLVEASEASIFEHDPGTRDFQLVWGRGRSLPADSLIAGLLAASPRALLLDPEAPGSAFLLLPEFERNWVLDAGASLIVSISDGDGKPRWLLCLGPSISKMPYSEPQSRALEALATSGALVLENRALRVPAGALRTIQDGPASVCSACGIAGPPSPTTCSACGGNLVEAPLPMTVAGKFHLVRLLGRGGMGVVFEAEDIDLGRRVALKTLPHVSSTLSVRLRVEARAMAGFIHPNLALVYGVESWRGTPVIVMEMLAGDTLASRIKWQGAAVEDVLRWGSTLAHALVAIHERALLHRDIKPSNVAFTDDGTVKLLDFGLARLLDVSSGREEKRLAMKTWSDVTPLGSVAGTPLYLSPEAATGDSASPAHDVWSFSLMLYECLAGSTVLRKFLASEGRGSGTTRLPDVRRWSSDCPPELAALLTECLRENPAERVRSAAELVDRLGRLYRDRTFGSGPTAVTTNGGA